MQIRQSAKVILDKRHCLAQQIYEDDSDGSSLVEEQKASEYKAFASNDFLDEIQIPSDSKQRVRIVFQFLRYPEYINKGGMLIINEGPNLKLMGKIVEPFLDGQ